MVDKQQDQYEQHSVETLFHDIATPLVITKMKAALMAEHFPPLVNALLESPELRHLLPDDQKLVDALASAPDILLSNLQLVQKKINLLSAAILHQTNNAAPANPNPVAAPYAPPGAATKAPAIKTILLVDDETVHRDIAEGLLSPYYAIDFANNGLEAISLCEQKHYDLILMDLHMPKMNGEQATIALRPRISHETVIVGLTSLPIGINKSGLLAMGFTDFLEKPLTLESLQKLLRAHFLGA